jgi:hypothetical protein
VPAWRICIIHGRSGRRDRLIWIGNVSHNDRAVRVHRWLEKKDSKRPAFAPWAVT